MTTVIDFSTFPVGFSGSPTMLHDDNGLVCAFFTDSRSGAQTEIRDIPSYGHGVYTDNTRYLTFILMAPVRAVGLSIWNAADVVFNGPDGQPVTGYHFSLPYEEQLIEAPGYLIRSFTITSISELLLLRLTLES